MVPLRGGGCRGKEPPRKDPARASVPLSEALSIWRGDALADLASEPFAIPEIARLDELHLSPSKIGWTRDSRSDVTRCVVGDLRKLASEHPLRERLTQQLMVALYRSGRQTEALAAYQRARSQLASELGIDPGPELQALERAVRHDPSLDVAVASGQEAPRDRGDDRWPDEVIEDSVPRPLSNPQDPHHSPIQTPRTS